jgi:hypothetical protein
MGGVEDAIADGVGGGGVGEVVVPVLRIELAGEDRRADAVAVLEDFEQVAALGVGDGSDGEVVDDEDIEASETCEYAREGAIGASETELVEEARGAAVGGAESLPTSLMGECAREVRLAGACRARDEDAVVFFDPAARRELSDDGLIELSSGVALDALDARLAEPELGLLESAPDAFRLASDPLGLDEEREALVERHGLDVGVALLVVPRSGHRSEAKGMELFDSWFLEHFRSPSVVVVAPTNILVGDAWPARLDVERGSAIESVVEDGGDVTVGARADGEGSSASRHER